MSNFNEDFKNIRTFTEKYSLLVLEYLKSFSLSSKFKTSEEEVRYFLYEYLWYLLSSNRKKVDMSAWELCRSYIDKLDLSQLKPIHNNSLRILEKKKREAFFVIYRQIFSLGCDKFKQKYLVNRQELLKLPYMPKTNPDSFLFLLNAGLDNDFVSWAKQYNLDTTYILNSLLMYNPDFNKFQVVYCIKFWKDNYRQKGSNEV